MINTLKNITTSNPSGYVKAGEAYSAVLTVTSGYMLPECVTVTINGNVLTAEDYAYSSETGLLTIAADKITGSVEIIATGVKKTWRIELDPDEVDFGTLPFGDDVPAAQAVTIKNTGNQPVTVGLPELDFGEDAFVFTQGDGYTGGQAAIAADAAASFTVQPKNGLPVGDYTVTVYTISGSDDTEAELFVNFEVTIAPVSIQTITGVTPPAAGQTPVTTISDTEQYTGTVTWKPVDSPFVHATQYIATITLTPKEGYTLTGVAENFFRVDGASTTNAADSGVITAIFPYTAPAAPTGGYTIDYVNETISIADGHEANTLPDFTGASVSDGIAITPGSTIYIRIAADGSVPASSSVPVTIPARPAAPDGLQVVNESLYGFRDGRITDVTADME